MLISPLLMVLLLLLMIGLLMLLLLLLFGLIQVIRAVVVVARKPGFALFVLLLCGSSLSLVLLGHLQKRE